MKKDFSFFYSFLLLIIAFSFNSCEFDSDNDNYIDIEKPKEEIPLSIDLAGVNPEDIIYVYNNTLFNYTLFTDNKEILQRQFYLDGKPIEANWQGETYLSVNTIDKEIHELKLVISLKTGTGSLAEYAGLEMYTGEFKFQLKFIEQTNNLNIKQTTDSEGYLKLIWDKPVDYEVTSYDIYNGNAYGELLASINDPNQTYFIDKDYVYGYKNYAIVANVKNSYNLTVIDNHTAEYIPITEDNFEMYRISANQAYVKWNNPNPFPSQYIFLDENSWNEFIIDDGDNNAVISTENFPIIHRTLFTLFILPKTAEAQYSARTLAIYGSFEDKYINSISIAPDVQNKQIISLENDSLSYYDITSMQKIKSVKHNLNLGIGSSSEWRSVQVSTDGKIAINDADGVIHIYSNTTLSNEISTLNLDLGFILMNNNRILSKERDGFKIYDVTNNKIVCSKLWTPSNSNENVYVSKISTSSNGKYIHVLCEQNTEIGTKMWTELLEADDNKISVLEKKDVDDTFGEVFFNPLKPTEMIIKNAFSYERNDIFYITNILTKEKKEINGNFMNIDPFTGNLLYIGPTQGYSNYYNSAYVLDAKYNKELITLDLINGMPIGLNLYNNNLYYPSFIETQSYMNLTTLKEWNQ